MTKDDYIIIEKEIQEELVDISDQGKVRPWREKKIQNLLLSEIYRGFDVEKFTRLVNCATFIRFSVDSVFRKRLVSANFCRVRLCPMCTWRRSLKIFSQVKCIMDVMQRDSNYDYLFLTLTLKNCSGEDLFQTLNDLSIAWKRLTKSKDFKHVVKGFYRGLEITHNLEKNTYHPHFHCIFVVDKSYFCGRNYLTQFEWTKLWKNALGVEYTPIVNIKKIKGSINQAVAEVAKYSVKSKDYIRPEDWELSEEIVKCLDKALDHRRLVSFGGVFKDFHKKLNLDNPVDGDLVHSGSDKINEDLVLLSYAWDVGYQQYRLVID